jgi:hypothetical protein
MSGLAPKARAVVLQPDTGRGVRSLVERWLRFELTAQDVHRYALALRARSWRRTGRTRVARLGAALLLGGLGSFVVLALALTKLEGSASWLAELGDDPLLRVLLVLLLGVLGLLAAFSLAQPRLTVWAAARRRDVLGPRRLRIGDDGIHLVTRNLTSVIAWSGVSRVERCDGDVHLYISDAEAVLVPQRAFPTTDDRDGFVEACLHHMAAERITRAD